MLTKNQYTGGGGDCLKRGAWTLCWFKGGGLGKKEGGVFLSGEGWGPNAHYEVKTTLFYGYSFYGYFWSLRILTSFLVIVFMVAFQVYKFLLVFLLKSMNLC